MVWAHRFSMRAKEILACVTVVAVGLTVAEAPVSAATDTKPAATRRIDSRDVPVIASKPALDRSVPTSAQPQLPWPSVSPSPEVWRTEDWTQQQAADWVNACPPGRFCTWIRHQTDGNRYDLFQFYRCQVYTLTNWLGVSNIYNHQNVQVELLGSRHEHLRYLSSGLQFITYWTPVFYINLCA